MVAFVSEFDASQIELPDDAAYTVKIDELAKQQ
jgi:hypothetical protein